MGSALPRKSITVLCIARQRSNQSGGGGGSPPLSTVPPGENIGVPAASGSKPLSPSVRKRFKPAGGSGAAPPAAAAASAASCAAAMRGAAARYSASKCRWARSTSAWEVRPASAASSTERRTTGAASGGSPPPLRSQQIRLPLSRRKASRRSFAGGTGLDGPTSDSKASPRVVVSGVPAVSNSAPEGPASVSCVVNR